VQVDQRALCHGNAATDPYYLGAEGKAYPSWTAHLLKTAHNDQVSIKDPGAFAHNPKYFTQYLSDSFEDLGRDVTNFTCPEVPAQ
jgi:hypothetical protein